MPSTQFDTSTTAVFPAPSGDYAGKFIELLCPAAGAKTVRQSKMMFLMTRDRRRGLGIIPTRSFRGAWR
jgi:hypothetical protein